MDDHPAIPKKVRDGVYIGGVIATASIGLVAGVTAIWMPALSEQVNATAVVATTFVGLIVGGLATVYRPGAQ